jgi:trimeric autotransporter adhesin
MKNYARLAAWALACLIFGSVSVHAQTITTLAGGGPTSVAPGVSPTAFSVGATAAVKKDGLGNTYVLDNQFGRVYKIDSTGKLTLFAGNGTTGFSGEGAAAITAAMNGPSGLCIDGLNNVYVADSDNAVVREILVTPATGKTVGNIYSVAGQFETDFIYGGDGGPATSAHLHFPDGCSFDTNGNMYIADRGNNAIRVVIGSAGVNPPGFTGAHTAGNIYLFAGSLGAAPPAPPAGGYAANGTLLSAGLALYGPFDVFVDSHNNVFYADLGNNFPDSGPNTGPAPFNNNVIREIPATAQTVPFAMNANAVYTVAGIPGVAGVGHTTSTTTPLAATNAELQQPRGISVDAAGDLFFVDNGNQVVREVPIATANGMTAGAIYDVAGNYPNRGFVGEGVAADTASLNFPAGTFVDSTGNLFIADQNNDRVREVVPSGGAIYSTGTITTFAGNGSTSYSTASPATAAQMNVVYGVAADSKTGDVIIADVGVLSDDQSLIRGISPPLSTNGLGTFLGVAGNNNFSNSAPLLINNALNMTFDSAGTAYIADTGNCIIRKLISSIVTVTIAGVEPTTPDPNHPEVTVPQCGFTGSGGVATAAKIGYGTDTTANPTAILGASGVAVDSHGNVFFSDAVNNIVYEVPATISADGSKFAGYAYIYAGTQSLTGAYGGDGGAANAAQLNRPQGLFIDIYDNLYIADSKNNVIREVPAVTVTSPVAMTAGNIYTVAGNQAAGAGYAGNNGPAASAQLNDPFMIAVDHALSIFIADSDNNVIRQVAGSGVSGKTQGNIYTVAGNHTAGFSGDGGAATAAELNAPKGLAIDGSGNLLIGDSLNIRVRSVAAIANVAGVPLATLSPNPLVLNAEPVGRSSAAAVITLTNTGGATLNVTGPITITGGNAADFGETDDCVTPGTVLPAGTCAINVIFTPQAGPLGGRSATLSIPTNVYGSPQTVTLNGTAGSPTATLNPTTLTFASTAVGQFSTSQAVTLTNSGNVATVINAGQITFTGANAGDFTETDNCAGTPVAPSGTCKINVNFKPTAAGSRTATLNVASNVGTASTVTITGTGANPTPNLTVVDTDQGGSQTVSAGATATFNLNVSSNNALTATITCTGAPAAATCAAAPASIPLTANIASNFKVTVTTTARGLMLPFTQPSTKMQPPSFLQIAPMASLALLFVIALMLGSMQNQAGRARTLRLAMSLCLILMPIAAATVLVGCGGGSSSSTPPPPATGTPAGTYTLTITATSGSTTGSTTVKLVVN